MFPSAPEMVMVVMWGRVDYSTGSSTFATVAMKRTLKLSVNLRLYYWIFQDRKHLTYVTLT